MKKNFIYALILFGILIVLTVYRPQNTVKSRKEILKEQKQEEKDRKQLKEIEDGILSESNEKIRREKLDDFLGEIDQDKYLPEDSIRTLENLKEKLTDKEVREIDKRLYKLYESIDEFEKAEKIRKKLKI